MPTASGHTTAIRASRVIGTDITDKSGERIGLIEDVILDKTSNRIIFAVARIGGSLTATQSYYPLPWSSLDYDEKEETYVVPFTVEQFVDAPAVNMMAELTEHDSEAARAAVYNHYNVERDW